MSGALNNSVSKRTRCNIICKSNVKEIKRLIASWREKKKSCVRLWFYLYECLAGVSGVQMVEMRWKKNFCCVIHCCVLPLVVRFHLRKMFLIAACNVVIALLSQEKSGDSVREAAEGCTVHLSLLSAAPSRGAGGAWLPLNWGPGIFPHRTMQ